MCVKGSQALDTLVLEFQLFQRGDESGVYRYEMTYGGIFVLILSRWPPRSTHILAKAKRIRTVSTIECPCTL